MAYRKGHTERILMSENKADILSRDGYVPPAAFSVQVSNEMTTFYDI